MLGVPSSDLLSISERKARFFNYNEINKTLDPLMFKNSRGKYRKPLGKPLELVIGNEDPDFTDFVSRCLTMDPRKRLTPNQALKHVWVLKGLPPQVLVHHQKMHNISTPELPAQILHSRNLYLQQQQTQKKQEQTSKSKSPIKSNRPKIMI